VLDDPERKLLRILNNCEVSNKPVPTFTELFRMTGRGERMLKRSLNSLQDGGFIKWDGIYTRSIVILNVWENQPIKPANRSYQGHG
jgi:hypothetical protein